MPPSYLLVCFFFTVLAPRASKDLASERGGGLACPVPAVVKATLSLNKEKEWNVSKLSLAVLIVLAVEIIFFVKKYLLCGPTYIR